MQSTFEKILRDGE